MEIRCPVCNGKNVGKIGTHQYYCWNCFIEFTVKGDRLTVYEIEEDGTLTSLNDLLFEEGEEVEAEAM